MASRITTWARSLKSPIDIGFLIGAVALVLVGWVSHRTTVRLRAQDAWVEHTYEVLRVLDQLEADVDHPHDATTLVHVADELARLQLLTRDNPAQQSRIDSLRQAIGGDSVRTATIIKSMQFEEQRLLGIRKDSTQTTAHRTTVIITFSTVLAVLLMAAALALLHADLARRREAELAVQESEAKYRLLMEQAADAILIVNSDAVCVEANARAAQILGRPQSEIPGLPLKAFVRGTGPSVGPVLPMLRYGHVTTGEFWVVRPDGWRVAVEIRATLLEDGRVQVIARDVSERKEVERVKDEFVSVVSHELRTPLTSIRGALGLLAAGRLDESPDKRRRMLDLAASNTDRLIRLINDILDIERINSGGIAFDRVELRVEDLVSQVCDAIRPIADRAGVSIDTSIDDVEIWADRDRMTQTLTNLLDNAIKFSPSGSHVDVTVRRDGRFALFEIRDQGRGIPPQMRDAVFNRFQQVDNSDSREKGGTGLGLAICRSIVEQHGGRIWVQSEVGMGSAFRFTIPLFADARATVGVAGAPRILICDDDADLLEVVRTTLAERGYQVYGARRGREAIENFDAFGAEIAILDILLPDISGIKVLRHIHSASPQTKLIVYSATYVDGPERDFIKSVDAVIVTKGRTTAEQLANEVERLVVPRPTPATPIDAQA